MKGGMPGKIVLFLNERVKRTQKQQDGWLQFGVLQ